MLYLITPLFDYNKWVHFQGGHNQRKLTERHRMGQSLLHDFSVQSPLAGIQQSPLFLREIHSQLLQSFCNLKGGKKELLILTGITSVLHFLQYGPEKKDID